MTLIAVTTAGGTSAATTTSLLLAAMSPPRHPALVVECDPGGGDIAAWAQLPSSPGWPSAISQGERSWATIFDHSQELPSGLRVVTSPPRPSQARSSVREAANGFAGLLAAMPDVLAMADCGRVTLDPPIWARPAQLTLLLLRQAASSPPATVARVDRTIEALEVLRGGCSQVGVVLIGGGPYGASDVATALGVELFGVLPEDAAGAGLVCGGWTVGKRAARTPLAKAAGALAVRIVETVRGRDAAAAVTR